MGFLDNISRTLNTLGQEAISQGSALAGNMRNSFQSMELDKQADAAFAELGKKYFETIRNNPPQEYSELVTRIKDLLTQAEFARANSRRERGVTVCPKCGREVAYGTSFCSGCGASVPAAPMQSQYEPYMVVKCPGCGLELPKGTAFCTSCGSNLQNVQPAPPSMPLGAINLSANGGTLSTPMNTQQPLSSQPMGMQPPMTPPPTVPPMAPPPPSAFMMSPPTTSPTLSKAAPVSMPSPAAPAPAPVPMPSPAAPAPAPVPMPSPAAPAPAPVPMPSPTIPNAAPAPTSQPVTISKDILKKPGRE